MGLFQDIIDLTDGNATEIHSTQDSTRPITDINEAQTFTNNIGLDDVEEDSTESAQNTEIEEMLKNDKIEERNDGIAPKESFREKIGNLKSDNFKKNDDKNFEKKEKSIKDVIKEVLKSGEPQTFTTKEGKDYSIMPNSKGGIDIYGEDDLQKPEISFDAVSDRIIDNFAQSFTNRLFSMMGMNDQLQQVQQEKFKEDKEKEESGILGLGKDVLDKLKEIVQNADDKDLNEALNKLLNSEQTQGMDK